MVQVRVPILEDDRLPFSWLNVRTVNVRDKAFGAVGDGIADDTTKIQAAIDAVPTSGGVVYLPAGTYRVSNTLSVARGNIMVKGDGIGATTIISVSTMVGDTPIFRVAPTSAAGADRALTVNAAAGATTVTMLAADAATFVVGDTVILKSNRVTDSESTTKAAGELHTVTAVDGTTGVVTLNDVILDNYLTTDVARLTRIPMLRNVVVEGISFTSAATSMALSTGGFTRFWFVDNLVLSKIEQYNAFHSLELRSCMNSRVEGSIVRDISNVTAGGNLRYGIWIASASQNITIEGCRFGQSRHAITTGGVTGTNFNGIQRNLAVIGCTFTQSDTAHIDCHDPADGVLFANNTIIGGMPFGATVGASIVGIQVRGKNVVVSNNVIRGVPGRGIMVFNANSNGVTIIGNNISGITRAFGSTTAGGEGIVFDSSGSERHVIAGNTIQNCAHRAISASGGNNDVIISGNSIDNCPMPGGSGTSIGFTNSARGLVIGNRVSNSTTGRWLSTSGDSDGWTLVSNSLLNNSVGNAPSLVGTNNSVHNNAGLNPIRPFPIATTTGAVSLNRSNGNHQYVTMTGNITLTVTAGVQIGDELTLSFTQDATGGRTITWPSNVKLAGGTLALTTAANATDVITLVWSPGTVWREKYRAMNTPA